MQTEITEVKKKRAKRVGSETIKKRMNRSEKLLYVYDLKKSVVDSLRRCGLDVKDGYLPYAKQFELLFMVIEPDLKSRRARLRRIISGTPRIEDAYWVEVLDRYSKEIRDISTHYCSVNFKASKLK
jgi:hypothetical protein